MNRIEKIIVLVTGVLNFLMMAIVYATQAGKEPGFVISITVGVSWIAAVVWVWRTRNTDPTSKGYLVGRRIAWVAIISFSVASVVYVAGNALFEQYLIPRADKALFQRCFIPQKSDTFSYDQKALGILNDYATAVGMNDLKLTRAFPAKRIVFKRAFPAGTKVYVVCGISGMNAMVDVRPMVGVKIVDKNTSALDVAGTVAKLADVKTYATNVQAEVACSNPSESGFDVTISTQDDSRLGRLKGFWLAFASNCEQGANCDAQ